MAKKAAKRKTVTHVTNVTKQAEDLVITIEKLGKPVTWTIPAHRFADLPRAQRIAFGIGVNMRVKAVIEGTTPNEQQLAEQFMHSPANVQAFLDGYAAAKAQA